METIKKIGGADLGSRWATLASLFPLWLISLAASVVLLLKVWLTFELLLFSFSPFILLFLFDEISTRYKTPFILLCALLLMIGMVGYQRGLYKDSVKVGWFILLLIFIATWVLASDAAHN